MLFFIVFLSYAMLFYALLSFTVISDAMLCYPNPILFVSLSYLIFPILSISFLIHPILVYPFFPSIRLPSTVLSFMFPFLLLFPSIYLPTYLFNLFFCSIQSNISMYFPIYLSTCLSFCIIHLYICTYYLCIDVSICLSFYLMQCEVMSYHVTTQPWGCAGIKFASAKLIIKICDMYGFSKVLLFSL